MSIFENLDERIAKAEAEELLSFKEHAEAEDRYWKAYKSGEGVEHAAILEKWALARSAKLTRRSLGLESLKILEPAKDADIASLKASLSEILAESEGDELSVFTTTRLDEWAQSIDPAFSFAEWGDVNKGTQGFFPVFNIHFPKGKYTPEMIRKINIFARVLRRDIDYVVDFKTTKEGSGKKRIAYILSVSGEGMHLAAVNYPLFRHRRPLAFGVFADAVAKVSYHAGDQSHKVK
jgi:hypothetical protein